MTSDTLMIVYVHGIWYRSKMILNWCYVSQPSSNTENKSWHDADAQRSLPWLQDQRSPTNSIIVQITDSCQCNADSSNACCTNIPHFNLGYSAFQKLAHPDYGVMNLDYRSDYPCGHDQYWYLLHFASV